MENQQSEQPTLPDQYVVLLEKVIEGNRKIADENRALRELVASRNESMTRLEERLKNSTSDRLPSCRRPRQRERIQVPLLCRRQARGSYNVLLNKDDFEGYNFDESFESQHNQATTVRVMEDVLHQNGGEQNCPWAKATVNVAIKRYFVSLMEKHKKKKNKKYEEHQKTCRKQGRQREKLLRRTSALEKVIDWDVHKRGQAAEVLVYDAMSSEESEFEEEDGKTKLVGYRVKRLPWESRKLKKIKKKLDRAYQRSLTKRASERTLPRSDANEPSARRVPVETLPAWAITNQQ